MKKVFGVLLIGLLSACASQTPQPSAEVEEKSVGAQPQGEAPRTTRKAARRSIRLRIRKIFFPNAAFILISTATS